jgi:uncharacterized protein
MKSIAILLINFYQKFLSPMLGKTCRFYPSCSSYSKEAFYKYGFLKGFFLTLKRLLKCHPFHSGGYDPLK